MAENASSPKEAAITPRLVNMTPPNLVCLCHGPNKKHEANGDGRKRRFKPLIIRCEFGALGMLPDFSCRGGLETLSRKEIRGGLVSRADGGCHQPSTGFDLSETEMAIALLFNEENE